MREDRLLTDLERLSGFTQTPGQGVTRFSWSEEDRLARAYLERELKAIDLSPWTDGIGNLRARMRGKDSSKAILAGSHFDTVRNGGAYDGTYGVIAALEVLRSFHDQGYVPDWDLEFIAFVEEEGSNFGCTCLGSKAITGQAGIADLKSLRNAQGRTAWQVLQDFGLNPEALPEQQIVPSAVAAYLEVHIEQNAVLEKNNTALGVVTAISGMRLFQVTYTGRSDHAASPMQGRKDPMAGFAEAASTLESLCKRGELGPDLSCTIGRVSCSPGVGIVIPHEVKFTIDIRHVDVAVLERAWEAIASLLAAVADARGLGLAVESLSASGGVRMDARIRELLRSAGQKLGADPLSLISGPAHDAAPMGAAVPAGLLFVPSVGGLSHCPEELTRPEHLVLGARVLEEAIRSFPRLGPPTVHSGGSTGKGNTCASP